MNCVQTLSDCLIIDRAFRFGAHVLVISCSASIPFEIVKTKRDGLMRFTDENSRHSYNKTVAFDITYARTTLNYPVNETVPSTVNVSSA